MTEKTPIKHFVFHKKYSVSPKRMLTTEINSFSDVTKVNWFFWRIFGIHPTKKYFFFYIAYSIVLLFLVPIYYPVSVGIELFQLRSLKDILENLAVNATVFLCSIKFFIILWKRKDILKIAELMEPLDRRIKDSEEMEEVGNIKRKCLNLMTIYAISYSSVMISGGLSLIFYTEKRLMYSAYFPFDWRRVYTLVILYQYIGISIQIAMNFADDTFPPIMLCLLSGHVKILCLRIQRIGNHCGSQISHHQELRQCIADHKQIIR